jgi:hypothetical protein
MRFLADVGVAMRVVEWLREQGHAGEAMCDLAHPTFLARRNQ